MPSITAIIVGARMYERLNNVERYLQEHKEIAAHGKVSERLTEHETRLQSQNRSLSSVRQSNDRLSNDLHQLRTDLKVLEQRVDIEHNSIGIDP